MFIRKVIVIIISTLCLLLIVLGGIKAIISQEKYIIGQVVSIDNVLDRPYSILIIRCEETNGDDFKIGDIIDVRSRTITDEPCPDRILKQYLKVSYRDYVEYENCVEITDVISFELVEENRS